MSNQAARLRIVNPSFSEEVRILFSASHQFLSCSLPQALLQHTWHFPVLHKVIVDLYYIFFAGIDLYYINHIETKYLGEKNSHKDRFKNFTCDTRCHSHLHVLLHRLFHYLFL